MYVVFAILGMTACYSLPVCLVVSLTEGNNHDDALTSSTLDRLTIGNIQVSIFNHILHHQHDQNSSIKIVWIMENLPHTIYVCVCVYLCLSMYTYRHTYRHTCIHTYIHTSIYPYMHACIHTYIITYNTYTLRHTYNTYVHTHRHTYDTYIHTHICIHIHVHMIHTYTHMFIHTIHTYIHTCTCTCTYHTYIYTWSYIHIVERQAQHRPDRLSKPRTGSVGLDRVCKPVRRLVRRKGRISA